jgi:protein-L-isoaspartate(D-aspartate) O-methyltransferase
MASYASLARILSALLREVPARLAMTVALLALPAALASGAGGPRAAERRALVEEVTALVDHTGDETGREKLDPRVLDALGRVPRHRFVPADQERYAYINRPLPIGYGQTISQPYIVALMTDLLNVKPGSRILEIGTGSGYQAAMLAELGAEVYTIEIVEPLGKQAEATLAELGYAKVKVRIGDGYEGWEAFAPYDGIIVTAAASHVPPPLVRQLKPGGRMVIPVGAPFMTQHLQVLEKDANGAIVSRQILPVRFVPLTGGH